MTYLFRTAILLLCTSPLLLKAQINVPAHQLNSNSNWVFGVGAGLSFAAAVPAPATANIQAPEGISSISGGQLLMYATPRSPCGMEHRQYSSVY